MKKVKILNVQFDVCTKDEALARILDLLKNRIDELNQQSKDLAAFIVADGSGG